ncbi:MAG: LytTR family DNA-binding domain-containing protein [Rhodothermaceae bacterium]|nr:LytTR family DNA-binding domain-containing protein [Rhodothermaceae bacterium]
MLHILVVDDEPPARARLKKMLKPLQAEGRIEVVGEAGDGVEALDFIEKNKVDLLFLDIRMPEVDGFGVLKRLGDQDKPIVVFTTAYDSYALKAFEANAVDYLLKPIQKKRLVESIERAEQWKQASGASDDTRLNKLLDWLENQPDEEEPKKKTKGGRVRYMQQISIPYRDRILVVPVERLVSAEINDGITRLCILTDQGDSPKPRIRQHIVNYTLEQLEDHLDPKAFMRIHRSAIVKIDHIHEMIPWFSGRYKLVLSGNHEVIASRERSKLLKERLMVDLKK